MLTGSVATPTQLFWLRHRVKLLVGAVPCVALAYFGLGKTMLGLLAAGGLGAAVVAAVWFAQRYSARRLLRLFPVLEEAALQKRSRLSSYIGDFEFPPEARLSCKEHEEQTPVGARTIAVFVFEIRGTRGVGMAQAKFVKTVVEEGACSDMQARASAATSLHEEDIKIDHDFAAHAESLSLRPLPRAILDKSPADWTLIKYFVDVVDVADVREAHITLVDTKETFVIYDAYTKSVQAAFIEDNIFEKKAHQSSQNS